MEKLKWENWKPVFKRRVLVKLTIKYNIHLVVLLHDLKLVARGRKLRKPLKIDTESNMNDEKKM